MVPNGWKKGLLDEGIELISGQHVEANCVNNLGVGIPYLTGPADFPNGKIIVTKFTNDGKKFSKKGDLLITVKGSGTGKVIESDNEYAISRQLMAIRPKTFNSKFVYYNLVSSLGRYEDAAAGLIPGISREDVLHTPLLIPPIDEQKAIAQILSTWDQAISATEKLLENSQQQKNALMQQLLTGKKRLRDEKGVEFSEDWNEYLLGNLGNTFTGLTGKTKDDFGSGVPYITYMNIFKNSRIDINQVDYVIVEEDENQNSVRYGDIFFTTSSETAEEVGMSSVLLEEVERLYLNSFCFGFRLNNFKVLLPQFAAYILRSSNIRKQISILGQGATRYNLSKNQLMKLILKLPTIAEQKKIAEVLTLSDQEIETLQKKLDCLKHEKKALMQQLLTGKKRVKVAA